MRILVSAVFFALLSVPALAAEKVVFASAHAPVRTQVTHTAYDNSKARPLNFRIVHNSLSVDEQVRNSYSKTVHMTNHYGAIMPVNAAYARSRIKVKPMKINPDGSAQLRGAIVGLGMDIYRFHGQAGDVIRILNAKAPAMQFAIFRPEIGMRFGNYQVLPVSGEYELRIVNDRKHAAYSKKRYYYSVRFTLTRPGQSLTVNQSAAPAVREQITIRPKSTYSVQPVAIRKQEDVPAGLREYRCRQGAVAAAFQDQDRQVRLFSQGNLLVLSAISGDPKGNVYYSDGRYMLAVPGNTRRISSLVEYNQGQARTLAANCYI